MQGLRLGPVAASVRSGSGRAYALALACGGLLSLAFPAPDIAPLAWLMPAGLIFVTSGASLGRGLKLGFVFGIGFFGLLLVWISIAGWVAWAVLVVLQASFVALFGGAWALVSRYAGRALRILAPPALWVSSEFLRSTMPVHGFAWGVLDQSQHNLSWMLKTGTLGGGWLVSFVVVSIAALLAEAATSAAAGRRPVALACVAAAAVSVAAPVLIGSPHADGRRIKVAIVQGNVPAGSVPGARSTKLAILRSHVELTESIAADHPDLVVWPESSVGLDAFHDPVVELALRRAARSAHAPMLVGAEVDAGPGHYRVVTLNVSDRGAIRGVYQKTHLVPFGEYAPYRAELSWVPMLDQIPSDAIPASHGKIFDVGGGEVAPVLSFEDDFSSLVQRRIDLGGRLLEVGTNTSTWGRSWASAQHVALSQVNAADNGVWAVHASLSGISAFVDPWGRIVSETPLDRRTTLVHDVTFARGVTFYARYGDWAAFACLGGSAVLLLVSVGEGLRRRRRKVRSAP